MSARPNLSRHVASATVAALVAGIGASVPTSALAGFAFTKQQDFGGGISTDDAALADTDGDGDKEMVTAVSNKRNFIYDYKGNSTGFAKSAADLTTTDNTTFSVGLADVIGSDAGPEVVFGNQNGNTVQKITDKNEFTDDGQSFESSESFAVNLLDADQDSDADVLIGNSSTSKNSLWTNNGSGQFANEAATFGSRDTADIAVGDIDGDGDRDAVVGNSCAANTVFTRDDGGLSFTDTGQTLAKSETPCSTGAALADIDGDGDLDAIFSNKGTSSNNKSSVYENDGSGNFTRIQKLATGDSKDVGVGDVDGDGDVDAVFANTGSSESARSNPVYTNDGTGTFSDSGVALGNDQSDVILVTDIEGDLDPDVVAANYRSSNKYNDNSSYVNEVPGVFSFDADSYSVQEDAGSVTLQLERTGGNDGRVSVEYSTQDGSAVATSDYTSTGGQDSWGDGATGTRSVTIDITDDATVEDAETFKVTLSAPNGDGAKPEPELVAPQTATVSIEDDDSSSGGGDDGASSAGDGSSSSGGGGSAGWLLLGLLGGLVAWSRRADGQRTLNTLRGPGPGPIGPAPRPR